MPALQLSLPLRADADYQFTTQYSFLPRNLLTGLLPSYLDWSGTEFRIYPGILVCVLALIGFTRREEVREIRFFIILGLVGLLVALGAFLPLHGILYRFMPGSERSGQAREHSCPVASHSQFSLVLARMGCRPD